MEPDPTDEPDSALVEALFDRLCDLPAARRDAELRAAEVDDSVRTAVRRLLVYFDAPPAELEAPPVGKAVEAVTAPERIGRYRVLDAIGSGAMGVVYRARQESPVRDVAVKVLRASAGSGDAARRFEREAQLLGRLQHPGIAQIFESGVAEVGGVPSAFIAMELVAGVPITEHARAERLALRERVQLVAELAEAVHHAHLRGVIHRDLKPTNVLVARGPERGGGVAPAQVKVIDFGVARAADADAGATLTTLAGQVVGTLAYMSPEQVRGRAGDVDARADVYGLGAMAYELLAERLPHDLREETLTSAARIIAETSPRPLGSLVPACRGDLEQVVAKALSKEPERRYQSANALAADLRRWLAHEPVEARPAGAVYLARRFARRHRALVALGAALLLALAVGGGVATYLAVANARLAGREAAARREAVEQSERAVEQSRLAAERAAEAERLHALAEERAERLLHRTDPDRLARAVREAGELWPAVPERVPAMDAWIEGLAVPLVERLAAHQAALDELRRGALPYTDDDRRGDRASHPAQPRLARLREQLASARAMAAGGDPRVGELTERERRLSDTFLRDARAEVARLEAALGERRTWRFADRVVQEEHDNLAELVADLRAFADPATGLLASVRSRRAAADSLDERTLTGAEPAAEWRRAIAAVRESPRYGGLELAPQLGLRPLSEDPASGLWEFWHVESGTRPRRDDAAEPPGWRMDATSGVVLVLVPGGRWRVSAQADDPHAPHYDPLALPVEGPVRELELPPYFLSKFELTQAQYEHLGGGDPSHYGSTFTWYGVPRRPDVLQANTRWNPVESVRLDEAAAILRRVALRLPTTVEWEVGARGGTDAPWWSGPDPGVVGALGAGNLADAHSRSTGAPGHWPFEPWSDAFVVHAPVGSLAPNPFGLHDTIGNLHELCSDVLPAAGEDAAVVCGGAFDTDAASARVTVRSFVFRRDANANTGLRPARSVEP